MSLFTCPNCEAPDYLKRFNLDSWEFIQCCKCNAEMFWPIPSDEELSAYYKGKTSYTDSGAKESERYINGQTGWANHTKNYVERREYLKTHPAARYVDLGCSYGFRAIELRKLGFNAWGVEYSVNAIDFINSVGGQGYYGSILDTSFPLDEIDYCFSAHTLEHMRNPYEVIKHVRDLLSPNGILELELPHWGSLVAQVPDKRWKWLVPRDHIHYFRATTLPQILRDIGFTIESVSTTADPKEILEVYDAFGVPPSLRTDEANGVIEALLRNGRYGHQLNIVARKG